MKERLIFDTFCARVLGRDVHKLVPLDKLYTSYKNSGYSEYLDWFKNGSTKISLLYLEPIPGGNQYNRWPGYRRSEYKKEIQKRIQNYITANSINPPRSKKWAVKLIRHGKRSMDKDNMYRGAKPFVDVLQENLVFPSENPFVHQLEARAILIDDSPDLIELTCDQKVRKTPGYAMEIFLFPLDDKTL